MGEAFWQKSTYTVVTILLAKQVRLPDIQLADIILFESLFAELDWFQTMEDLEEIDSNSTAAILFSYS